MKLRQLYIGFNSFPIQSLTDAERESILDTAYLLMLEEKARAVITHDNGHFVIVTDCRGTEYLIGRTEHLYCLYERRTALVGCHTELRRTLKSLSAILSENYLGPSDVRAFRRPLREQIPPRVVRARRRTE